MNTKETPAERVDKPAFSLTPSADSDLMKNVCREIVAEILRTKRESIALLSPAQAGGLLDVRPNTLLTMKIPRVMVTPTTPKYRLADIEAYILSKLER